MGCLTNQPVKNTLNTKQSSSVPYQPNQQPSLPVSSYPAKNTNDNNSRLIKEDQVKINFKRQKQLEQLNDKNNLSPRINKNFGEGKAIVIGSSIMKTDPYKIIQQPLKESKIHGSKSGLFIDDRQGMQRGNEKNSHSKIVSKFRQSFDRVETFDEEELVHSEGEVHFNPVVRNINFRIQVS